MNKQEFLNRLAAELTRLPREEVQAAMEYYSEYLDEAGPENEEETIRELGSPSKIATQIKADYAVKQLDHGNGRQSTKKGINAIVWVILGIFAAPIGLPLAIAFGAVAFALFISLIAILFSLVVSFGAACISGIAMIIIGIVALPTSVFAGLMLIGFGLVTTGIMALLCVGVVIGGRALIRIIARYLQKANEVRRKKRLAKEVSRHE